MAEEDFEELSPIKMALLDGIPSDKRRSVLKCMDARMFRFAQGTMLSDCRKAPTDMMYLAKGRVRVDRLGASGERSILFDCVSDVPLATCDTPSIFYSDDMRIVALENCVVMDLDFSKENESCTRCIRYMNRVRKNAMHRLGLANGMFMQRIDILSRRSIRSKIAAYLVAQAEYAGSDSFEVGMTRQELADFLCVERSALSREIGRMRAEGLVDCVKGRFKVHEDLSTYA